MSKPVIGSMSQSLLLIEEIARKNHQQFCHTFDTTSKPRGFLNLVTSHSAAL
jgi:hypothetical protein